MNLQSKQKLEKHPIEKGFFPFYEKVTYRYFVKMLYNADKVTSNFIPTLAFITTNQ